ncbi:MAG: WG repeat-containing protein [Bacillota bacterium]
MNEQGKGGYIDRTGAEVIPCTYGGGDKFSGGLARVSKDGELWGYIDQTGAEVIPFIYDNLVDFYEGLSVVAKDGKYGYIDKTGAEVIPCTYAGAEKFSGGLAAVTKDGELWGFVDQTGAEIIPFIYTYVEAFSEGLALVVKDGKGGYIDQTGAEVIPFVYQNSLSFSEGLAAATKDGELWGYIDQTGAEVIPFIYKEGVYKTVGSFSEGLARVYVDDTMVLIDNTGDVVVDFTGNVVFDFTGNVVPILGNQFSDGHIIAALYDGDNFLRYVLQNPLLYPVTTNPVLAPTTTEAEVETETEVTPAETVEPTETTYKPAKSTTSLVTVNGQATDFDAYLIEGNNYFKLRDLAYAFTGTGKQFEVTWDAAQSAINLLSGQAYTIAGGEMAPASGYTKSASPSSSQLLLNGTPISLSAYVIEGNTYFKLRDICEQLDIEVTWDETKKVIGING